MDLKTTLSGRFIVLDGPDGSGKSTQIRLLAGELTAAGLDVVTTRDPGGTAIGDRIREVLLHHDLSTMDVRCEALLFMASRAQLVGEVITPALQAGRVVLCDRFVSSTCAYQVAAGFEVQKVIELARYAVGDTWPDLTIVLDVPTEQGFKRIGRKPHHAGGRRARHDPAQGMLLGGIEPDAMEARSTDFHRKVRELYRDLASAYPAPVEVIDGSGTPEEVQGRIRKALERLAP